MSTHRYSRSNCAPRRKPGFNFEHFLFKTKWNFYHFIFTIVALAWAGFHGYDDVRGLFEKVVSAHEVSSSPPCACHKPAKVDSP